MIPVIEDPTKKLEDLATHDQTTRIAEIEDPYLQPSNHDVNTQDPRPNNQDPQ